MVSARAYGLLRQIGIAALADELDYARNAPWDASVLESYKGQTWGLLKRAGSRPLRSTLHDIRWVRETRRSELRYVRDRHVAAVSALRRCSAANEPFTLLLRDFDAEAHSLVGQNRGLRTTSHFGTPRDQLQAFLNILGAEHPVISVVNHEYRPINPERESRTEIDNGIYHLALTQGNWTAIVPRLADAATMILVLAREAGPGLRFELQVLDQIAAHDRTVLVLADRIDGEELASRMISVLGADMIASDERRRAQRECVFESAVARRFGRRITLGELQGISSDDAEALAVRQAFTGLLPLSEPAYPGAKVKGEDEARERQISDAIREIEELQSRKTDTEVVERLISLMLRVGHNYNELRKYDASAAWMRKALDLAQLVHDSPTQSSALILRDGLIAALNNGRNSEEARDELLAQLVDLRSSSTSDDTKPEFYLNVAARMWLHIGRLRGESKVPVADLETGLTAWNDGFQK